MRALLVGYGKMGKAIEAVLVSRGHTVTGRYGRREICLEGEEGEGVDRGRAEWRHRLRIHRAGRRADASSPSSFLRKSPFSPAPPAGTWLRPNGAAREQGVPFLHSSNFSLGVAALRRAVAAAAAALAPFPEFEPGIVERHHAQKKDAPSGTAKMLAATVEQRARAAAASRSSSLRQGGAPGEHVRLLRGGGRDARARPPRPLARDLRAGRRPRRGVDAHLGPRGPRHLRRLLQRRVPPRNAT